MYVLSFATSRRSQPSQAVQASHISLLLIPLHQALVDRLLREMAERAAVFHVRFGSQLKVVEVDALLDDGHCETAGRLDYDSLSS